MEGKALTWFQDLEASGGITSWDGFTQSLLTRFGLALLDDPMEALTRLRKTTIVEAYKLQFEVLSNRLKGLAEPYKLSCFLSGLREDIRFIVRYIPTRPFLTNTTSDTTALVPVQRLSPLQMKEQRAKGLCYNCDDKWGPGHKCKSARLFIMECADSKEDEPQPVQQPPFLERVEVPSGGEEVDLNLAPKISIHALAGSLSPKTIRILGHVNGCVVVILIDTGSTHNFMDPSIQLRVHLQSQSTIGLLVRVANGDTLFSTSKCEDIQFHMQGNTFHTDFYVLTLGGCDIVLGVQWLCTLGPILWDFVQLSMEFTLLDFKHVLQGITPTEVSLMDGA
ncbi:hypothetical protein Patl1_22875 [Pistacia atlantica]|uniref:Uncharacterized protein n=1 Tax=Pistacia atlantica TaxID=434234 RepID=A0ACC0ZWP7_9ROSI|nr:hypothetical protein Patl1_22875 [Pistacia atlantica]